MNEHEAFIFNEIKYPVKYDKEEELIMDAENKHLCDIRGFGWIQYLEYSRSKFDALGLLIEKAINNMVGIKNVS